MPLEFGKKLSKIRIEKGLAKGKNNPMYGKIGSLNPNFGKKSSEKTTEAYDMVARK